jgi:hypothetical protein
MAHYESVLPFVFAIAQRTNRRNGQVEPSRPAFDSLASPIHAFARLPHGLGISAPLHRALDRFFELDHHFRSELR